MAISKIQISKWPFQRYKYQSGHFKDTNIKVAISKISKWGMPTGHFEGTNIIAGHINYQCFQLLAGTSLDGRLARYQVVFAASHRHILCQSGTKSTGHKQKVVTKPTILSFKYQRYKSTAINWHLAASYPGLHFFWTRAQ